MEWNLDDGRPIWPQIKERLMAEIAAGRFPMGEPFPTVRELAEDAKVNRNTMQRALSELEAEGLVITNRTAGRTVTTDRDLIRSVRGRIAKEKIETLVAEMESLGISAAEVIGIISRMKGEVPAADDKEKGESDR
ncbi:MAG: GntR family transcriptional regulator [Firmicutes bacterium]|nr:GntR family transcriptional regulator [Bacillota bacterium]